MKTLYFDIISGISGDMALAALLQMNVDLEELNTQLSLLLKGTVKLSLDNEKVSGIAVQHLNIDTTGCKTPHRDFNSISRMLRESSLSSVVIEDSINIFKIIADSESKMHDLPISKVHFHEVGAIDSIIDIVGVAYCMDVIQASSIISSSVVIGNGLVKTEHGMLPVPAPATMDILQNIPLKRIEINSELTTPTGAAVISYYADDFTHEFEGQIRTIAYSTGTKRFENHPNMLRVLEMDIDTAVPHNIHIIETNIDDDTGENLGTLMALLMESDALDAFYIPIFCKKNRPAFKLTVMTTYKDIDLLMNLILKNSSSAGVRHYPVKRIAMNRSIKTVKYQEDDIRVKVLTYDGITKYSPEWEDIVAVSKKYNLVARELYQKVLSSI